MQNWTILTTSSAITLFWATITSCLEISKQISLLLSLLARVNFYIAAWVNVSKGVRSRYSSAQNSPVEKFKQNKIQSHHQWSTRPPIQSGPLLPLLFSFSFIFICSVHTGLLVVSWPTRNISAFGPLRWLFPWPGTYFFKISAGLTPSPPSSLCFNVSL